MTGETIKRRRKRRAVFAESQIYLAYPILGPTVPLLLVKFLQEVVNRTRPLLLGTLKELRNERFNTLSILKEY
jgi:hypothetical protein